MALPTPMQDTPMRALAAHLKAEVNDRVWAIFDAAGEARQDAIREAVPYRPDLLATKTFPLLSVYRTGCSDVPGGRWRAELRWQMQMSAAMAGDQQDFLLWVHQAIASALEVYWDSEDPCVMVDVGTMRSEMGYLTVSRGTPQTALSFPTVQFNFEFTDLEAS